MDSFSPLPYGGSQIMDLCFRHTDNMVCKALCGFLTDARQSGQLSGHTGNWLDCAAHQNMPPIPLGAIADIAASRAVFS